MILILNINKHHSTTDIFNITAVCLLRGSEGIYNSYSYEFSLQKRRANAPATVTSTFMIEI
jgi:hypothetical protein